ncbi:MAG: hypothetical protein HYV68_00740 [Candidatus Taylorbacteria bacterium]|nr:hypothetical protein [Candidatus Taylorbacteria bacterium]
MTNSGIKRTVTAFACIAALIAILVCPFSRTSTSPDSLLGISTGISMPGDESSNHNVPNTHVSDLKEMTSASLAKVSVTSMLLLLFLFVVIVSLVSMVDAGLSNPYSPYLDSSQKGDLPYQAKSSLYTWLSLFERAPSLIKTA